MVFDLFVGVSPHRPPQVGFTPLEPPKIAVNNGLMDFIIWLLDTGIGATLDVNWLFAFRRDYQTSLFCTSNKCDISPACSRIDNRQKTKGLG